MGFWVGLIIFTFACIEVFSVLWTLILTPNVVNVTSQLKFATPFIVGGVVFIIVGFYMKSGVKREVE